MPTAPIPPPEEVSAIGQTVLWIFSSGGLLTAIGGLLWFVRKDGQKDTTLAELSRRFEEHEKADERRFTEMKDQYKESEDKQHKRHEDNLEKFGKLPDKEDLKDLRETIRLRMDTLEGLVRARN